MNFCICLCLLGLELFLSSLGAWLPACFCFYSSMMFLSLKNFPSRFSPIIQTCTHFFFSLGAGFQGFFSSQVSLLLPFLYYLGFGLLWMPQTLLDSPVNVIVFLLFLSLSFFWFYIWFYGSLAISLESSSFLSFFWLLLSTLFFSLGFLRGLRGSFHLSDLPPWAPYRYALYLLILGLILLLWLWPRFRSWFLSSFYGSWFPSGFHSLLGRFVFFSEVSVFLLNKISHPLWAYFLWFLDLWLRCVIPLLQSWLFLLWAWGDLNLQYSLLLLPLSWLSLLYHIFFHFLRDFHRQNHEYILSLLEVSASQFVENLPRAVTSEDTPYLWYRLSSRARTEGFSQDQGKLLISLWLRSGHAQLFLSRLFSWHPWIIFFRILAWSLLAIGFFIPPCSLDLEFNLYFPREERIPSFLWQTYSRLGGVSNSRRFYHTFWVKKEFEKELIALGFDRNHPIAGSVDVHDTSLVNLHHWLSHSSQGRCFYGGAYDLDGRPWDFFLHPFDRKISFPRENLVVREEVPSGNFFYEWSTNRMDHFYAHQEKQRQKPESPSWSQEKTIPTEVSSSATEKNSSATDPL